MSNIAKTAKKALEEADNSEIRLTMAKLNLQWWINKNKNEPDVDYSQRVHFARFELERATGQKVKLR